MLRADRWELPDLQSAAATALEATPAAEWEWETLMAVLSLPPGCRDSRAFSRAITAATAKLQQQLGDLELWHNDASGIKQLQLLMLPFMALKQLLQDPTTRVHSENTVLYSIQEWHEYQQQDSEAGAAQLQQQAAELLRLVRMRHCSQLYVATVFGPSALAASCFTPAELQLAVAISVCAGRSSSAWQAAKEANSPVLAKHPAWSADKRPPSALKQSFDWRLPLSELQPVLERHLAHPGRDTEVLYCPTTLTCQGHELGLELECSSSTKAQPSTTFLGVYLRVRNLPDGAVCRVKKTLEVVPAVAAEGEVLRPFLRGFGATNGWGWPEAIRVGTVTTWQEAAAVLRQQGLVHAGTGGAGKSLLLRLRVIEIH